MVAALGAHLKSTFQNRHVIKAIAGPLHTVNILLQQKDQKGDQAIDPGKTLQKTRSTGKKDLHREPSGAGIVGKHVIVMTTFALGAGAFKIKV